jgi:hypothetical protein
MKILPVGAQLMYVDWWTDMMKLKGTLHDYANMPKNHYQGKGIHIFWLSLCVISVLY